MNKWVIFSCVLLWARHGEGGALKCLLDDEACTSEQSEEIEQQEKDIRRPIGADADAPAECLPGSEWDSHCHSCRCSADGEANCLKRPECHSIIEEPIRCKPNTTFARECNTCVCLENGLGLCTVKHCQRIPTPALIKTKADMPEGVNCAPGTTWESQCNSCFCSPQGRSACTLIACIGQELEPDLECAPHSQWKRDCNMCWCTPAGRAMCTKMGCGGNPVVMNFEDEKDVPESGPPEVGVDHIEHSACKPSTTFYSGCNPCHCNEDGTDFTCDNKPCPLPADVEVFHELNALKSASKTGTKKVCVENRMFILNCNTCWCNEDGTSYFCTRKVCVQDSSEDPVVEEGKPENLRIIKRECRPDEVFELECNMCRCNADGKSFSCTRRACIDEDSKNLTQTRKTRATPQEAPKNCKPDQEFRLDCNTCLCDNEGKDFSCTRIDCQALNNNKNNNNNGARRKREVSEKVMPDCVPGSVFGEGCSVCRCTADGGHATCTLKRCAQSKDSNVSATESSFRCNPGEQFKQSCNDCSCSADGKSVFCTLLVCDETLTPK